MGIGGFIINEKVNAPRALEGKGKENEKPH